MRISILILGLKALKVNKKELWPYPAILTEQAWSIAHIYRAYLLGTRWTMARARAGEAEGGGGVTLV